MWHYLEHCIGYIKAIVVRKDQSFDQPSREVSNITMGTFCKWLGMIWANKVEEPATEAKKAEKKETRKVSKSE